MISPHINWQYSSSLSSNPLNPYPSAQSFTCMATTKASNGIEWRINLPDGTSSDLVPESSRAHKMWMILKGLIVEGFILKIWRFLEKAWRLAVAEPKKVIHGFKVGLALSIVSLFYFLRPLYDGVGSNALWAVMTVVVVFEYTVGATVSKSINRTLATIIAGGLGLGVHWVADQSSEVKPVILGASVFIFGSAATFSRFIPSIKARFDYGAVIFILTFSFVSVSGYRVEKLLEMAEQRLFTIAIGASLCVIVCLIICPIWAGEELHSLITSNLDKLGESLDGCVAEYFTEEGMLQKNGDEEASKKSQSFNCVLNSKATEESLANLTTWEPAHGRFNFRHPWKQYVKIGASMRSCAYSIATLNSCISIISPSSDAEPPPCPCIKKHLSPFCLRLSSCSADILKQLAMTIKTMTKSLTIDLSVSEMNFAVQELQNTLKSLPAADMDKANPLPLMEVLPLVTAVTMLIEIAARVESIADAVEELASLAEFKPPTNVKPKHEETNLTSTSNN